MFGDLRPIKSERREEEIARIGATESDPHLVGSAETNGFDHDPIVFRSVLEPHLVRLFQPECLGGQDQGSPRLMFTSLALMDCWAVKSMICKIV